MEKFVVLFRGINVGGNNILPMKELKVLLLALGYSEVETYIQSGNVVLVAEKVDLAQISSAIESKYCFRPNVMVLSKKEFIAAVNNNPYVSDEGKTIHFYFCEGRPQADLAKLELYKSNAEQYAIKNKVFYLHAPDGVGRSKLAAKAEACLGVPATSRNLNTVNQLNKMLL